MSGHFLLAVDLGTFTVEAWPAAALSEGLVVAVSGYVAGSDTPAELVRNAYRTHGNAVSATVVGQYAAVIVDQREGRVVLAQDSLGVRPLFWSEARGRLIASSDLEALVRIVGVSEFDPAYFAGYLASGRRPSGRTPYRGVERVDGGDVVVVDRRGRRTLRPWSPSPSQRRPAWTEAVATLSDLLDAAVVAALPSQGTVLCELSGGLDSTTVVAYAAARRAISALTVGSSSAQTGDDLNYAQLVVDALGMPWHRIDSDACPPLSAAGTTFAAEPGDELRSGLHAAYRNVIAETDATVVLTGIGGDQVLGGTRSPLPYVADRLRDGDLRSAVLGAKQWGALAGGHRAWTHSFLHDGLRPVLRHLTGRPVIVRREDGPPPWITSRLLGERPTPVPGLRVRLPGDQAEWDEVREGADQQGTPFRLHLGAECRHPLLHRPLVDFMLSLAPEYRFGPDSTRRLHRQAIEGRVPGQVRRRLTKSSDHRMLERALLLNTDLDRALVNEPRVVSLGWVDGERWREAVSRARFGVLENPRQFYAAVCTELWLQQRERHGPEPTPSLVPVRDKDGDHEEPRRATTEPPNSVRGRRHRD